MSLPLPAANGTTMVTGRDGQSCAAAGAIVVKSVTVKVVASMAAIILKARMLPPVTSKKASPAMPRRA
jgi:hypothetical protein